MKDDLSTSLENASFGFIAKRNRRLLVKSILDNQADEIAELFVKENKNKDWRSKKLFSLMTHHN